MYRVERALFYTANRYSPVPGTIITLENGTSWLVTHRRSFGFYADSVHLLQIEDVNSSHKYSGYAIEAAMAMSQHQPLHANV